MLLKIDLRSNIVRDDPHKYLHYERNVNLKNVFIETPARLKSAASISSSFLGAYTYTGNSNVFCDTVIGRYCSIGNNVSILSQHPSNWLTSHKLSYEDDLQTGTARQYNFPNYSGLTFIGHDVWIGENVKIKSGVKIGTGSILAAGTIVTKNVEPFSIVGGIPAKHISKRYEQEIELCIRSSNWWNYDIYDLDLTFDNPKVAIQELNRLKEQGLKNFSLRTYRRFNTVNGEVKMEKDIYTFERFQDEKLKRFLENDIFCT